MLLGDGRRRATPDEVGVRSRSAVGGRRLYFLLVVGLAVLWPDVAVAQIRALPPRPVRAAAPTAPINAGCWSDAFTWCRLEVGTRYYAAGENDILALHNDGPALLLALLLAGPPPQGCTVSTDIAQLRERYGDELQRARGQGIESVSITGDHTRLVYMIRYVADWKGREIAHTEAHAAASRIGRESCELLRSLYPSDKCSYQVRDGKGRPVCDTEVAANGSGSTVCVGVVGEDDKKREGTIS